MNKKNRLKILARQKSNIKAQGNELMLYGVIGDYWDDLDGKKVVELIKSMSGDITVRVNSPGGDVFDGVAIMNALKAHNGKVTVVVEALAASIASIIAMSGDEIIMSEGSFLMIHNPWTIAVGDAKEFEHMAGVLTQLGGTLADIYSKKTGKVKAEIQDLMDAETWLDAKTAVEMGFADKTDAQVKNGVENFDLSVFSNVPDPLRVAAKVAKPATIRDYENFLHSAGYSRSESKLLASRGFDALPSRDVEEEIDSEKLLAAIEDTKQIFKQETI